MSIRVIRALGLLACGWVHAAPPGEVQNLRHAADRRTLTWDATPGATSYTLYRGYLRELGPQFYGTHIAGEVPTTSTTDGYPPAKGEGFFYLVTANGADGEGTLGFNGAGGPRPNNFPFAGFAAVGKWEGLRTWPTTVIHAALLRNGRVMTWQGFGATPPTYVWDPVTDTFSSYPAGGDIFCAGHSFLSDGRLLTTGGTSVDPYGHDKTFTFDPASPGWIRQDDMADSRYYPTNTVLGDGRTLVFAGTDADGDPNPMVEAYVTQGQEHWEALPGAAQAMLTYPRMHLLPSGRVFRAGPEQASESLDPATQTWQPMANSAYGPLRSEGTSVLLPPGQTKVVIAGGTSVEGVDSALATATAELIDLAQPSPVWVGLAPMHFPRKNLNAVLLPDQKVLFTGGGYDEFVPVWPAEIFDSTTLGWTIVGTPRTPRLYHSVALLLADARVMVAGSVFDTSAEFYSPGYLFRGPRPVISTAPATAGYGTTVAVDTAQAGSISSVVLMRPGAVTHSFNMEQRCVPVSFSLADADTLNVTMPSSSNVAPPGYYMMFILNGAGVPSVAKFVRLS